MTSYRDDPMYLEQRARLEALATECGITLPPPMTDEECLEALEAEMPDLLRLLDDETETKTP